MPRFPLALLLFCVYITGMESQHTTNKHALKKGVVILLLILSGTSLANSITQYQVQYNTGTGKAVIDLEMINDDNGAVYDSYDLTIFSNLAAQLWQLPHNQITYTSRTNMTGDWNLVISDSLGEVYNGWYHDENFSALQIDHGPFGYDDWLATHQDPSQDMMYLRMNIPLTQLDGNTNGWSADDPADWEIVPGQESVVGVAHEGVTTYEATGKLYTIMSLAPVTNYICEAVEIYFSSVSNQTYQAQYCTNLVQTNWVDLGEVVDGKGGTHSFFDSTRNSDEKFYRVIKIPVQE